PVISAPVYEAPVISAPVSIELSQNIFDSEDSKPGKGKK
ncbi:MAG: hypothetical protein ACD_20C00183G0001, partial [uncultured bacterium]